MVRTRRGSLFIKCGAAVLLATLADLCDVEGKTGSWLGVLAALWLASLVATRPAVRRGPARVAVVVAAGFVSLLFADPGLVAWILFWSALSTAALLPRASPFDDAWRWMRRLGIHGVTGPLVVAADLRRIVRPRQAAAFDKAQFVRLLVMPVVGTALFVALFACANPLIGRAFGSWDRLPIGDIAFWLFAFAVVWPSLRPCPGTTRPWFPGLRIAPARSRVPVASILISLAFFNAVFAIQNALDLAYLWSGAPLPAGVTLAEYAHRGAYPLILTALLAALFVVTMLEPGSPTSAHRGIRWLVVAWIAQNVFLVASSILRTCDYIAAYMLTSLRVAALAWMVVVALGLVLICWRLLAHRGSRWLINANALVASTIVVALSVVDTDAVAARWNVRHAREVGGHGVALDLCALDRMGGPALIPLIELEQRLPDGLFRDRVQAVRRRIMNGNAWTLSLEARQADWRTWNWRDERRLAQAESLGVRPELPESPLQSRSRACDGTLVHPIDSASLEPDP